MPGMLPRRLLLASTAADAGGGANVVGVALGTVIAVLVAIAGAASYIWIRWRRGDQRDRVTVHFQVKEPKDRDRHSNAGTPRSARLETKAPEPASYTMAQIQAATEGFKLDGLLRESGYGSVHYGEGPNGEAWAVKRAKGLSVQGEHLFHSEVDFLAKVSHPNILPLRGFCAEGGHQVLVLDYMANGSVASWLRPATHTEASRPPLTFQQRLDIAEGVADALRYLHAFRRPTIIHRDVRSDVVLLDADMRPLLGGLGLLKHLPGEGLRLRMANRKGYLDPEYFQTYKVTPKCDVYSFGVVLLELLTGCAPFVQITRSAAYRPMPLPQWARQAVEAGKVREILDPRMPSREEDCPASVVEAFATLACACVSPTRKERPDMARVAALLKELKHMPVGANRDVSIHSGSRPLGKKVAPLATPEM